MRASVSANTLVSKVSERPLCDYTAGDGKWTVLTYMALLWHYNAYSYILQYLFPSQLPLHPDGESQPVGADPAAAAARPQKGESLQGNLTVFFFLTCVMKADLISWAQKRHGQTAAL